MTGGAVAGGRIYGEYPLLRIGARRDTDRADDVGGGRFIPTMSSDQYAATLARWFGVPDEDLGTSRRASTTLRCETWALSPNHQMNALTAST